MSEINLFYLMIYVEKIDGSKDYEEEDGEVHEG